MIAEWELWACAETIMRQHGDRAYLFVADRLGSLAVAGDQEGVATWQKIAARLEQLTQRGLPS